MEHREVRFFTAAAGMVAIRVTEPMKVAVVGAASYFPPAPPMIPPGTVASNIAHRAEGSIFKWPFERDDQSRKIPVDGPVMANALDLALPAGAMGRPIWPYPPGRWVGDRIHDRRSGRPVLRSVQWVRVFKDRPPYFERLLPVLSEPPAGSLRSACTDRHAADGQFDPREPAGPRHPL